MLWNLYLNGTAYMCASSAAAMITKLNTTTVIGSKNVFKILINSFLPVTTASQ